LADDYLSEMNISYGLAVVMSLIYAVCDIDYTSFQVTLELITNNLRAASEVSGFFVTDLNLHGLKHGPSPCSSKAPLW